MLFRPTVSSVSPNTRYNGRWNGGDDHGDELCRGSDGDVRQQCGDERGGGERHADHGDDTGRKRGSSDGNGDESGSGRVGVWRAGSRMWSAPTVSSVSSEQWHDGRRDGGNDHGDELCGGSDGDVRQRRQRRTWWW